MSRKPMSCQQVSDGDFVEKYLRGEGTRGEREAFERHYFECQACYEKLRACRLLRAELQPAPAIEREVPRPRMGWGRVGGLALAASLVLAVAGFGWWVQRQRAPSPAAPPAAPSPEPTVVAPAAPPPAVPLAELSRVEPPHYEEPRLRGPVDESTRLFREAMKRYAAADYAAAARGLAQAERLDPTAPDPPFYLGISWLMVGDAPAAVEALGRAVRISSPAAADEVRFYLAKAYLRLEDVDAARKELRRVVDGGGAQAAEAERLLEALPVGSHDLWTLISHGDSPLGPERVTG